VASRSDYFAAARLLLLGRVKEASTSSSANIAGMMFAQIFMLIAKIIPDIFNPLPRLT
jgi:hypothetical protein